MGLKKVVGRLSSIPYQDEIIFRKYSEMFRELLNGNIGYLTQKYLVPEFYEDDPIETYHKYFENMELNELIERDPELFYKLAETGELGKVPFKVIDRRGWVTNRKKEAIKKLVFIIKEIAKR